MLIGLMTAAVNLVVGVFVGLCGVAGFLLPMFYTTVLEMRVSQGLALSFSAFIVSGILGSWNFKKAGNLDVGFGFRLSIGSLAGAVLGVYLNRIIPEERVKVLLYLVVLLSGISILCRKDKKAGVQGKDSAVNAERLSEKQSSISIRNNLPLTLLLGFVTGAVCSLSGAGGPVLVMPLLVLLGIPVHTAVGVALFNSIFIGIPAAAGYLLPCDFLEILPILAVALIGHGVGVFYGSKNAARINQGLLKKGIAIFSILIALWKLFA